MPDLRIDPDSVSLTPRGTQQFTASTQSGPASNVTWEALPPEGAPAEAAGTISPQGGLYTAPEQVVAPIEVKVRATLERETATAIVRLTPASAEPRGLLVRPPSVTLEPGTSQRFHAEDPSGAAVEVNWSVSSVDQAVAGSINEAGDYRAPDSVTAERPVTVTATDKGNASRVGTARVTLSVPVTPPATGPASGSIKVKPETAILGAGQSQSFKATDASGAPVSVTWALSAAEGLGPDVIGSIDRGTGDYTAPKEVTIQRVVAIIATTPSRQLDKALIVLAPGKVTVIPGEAVLRAGEIQRFEAQVSGDERAAVVWRPPSPTRGELDDRGEYRAPAKIAEDEMVIITASSKVSGDQGHARIRLLADPWTGPGVHAVGAWLLCLFLVPIILALFWPPPPERATLNAAQAAVRAAVKVLTDLKVPGATPEQLARVPEAQRAVDEKKAVVELELTALEQAARDEFRLLLLVVLAGALGSFVHLTRSYVDFVGNQRLRPSWVWWYLLQPFTGSALAVVVYLVLRGGFLTGVASSNLNPYGFVAMAALVGLFSKQATNKLDELFTTMFRTDKKQELKDKLIAEDPR